MRPVRWNVRQMGATNQTLQPPPPPPPPPPPLQQCRDPWKGIAQRCARIQLVPSSSQIPAAQIISVAVRSASEWMLTVPREKVGASMKVNVKLAVPKRDAVTRQTRPTPAPPCVLASRPPSLPSSAARQQTSACRFPIQIPNLGRRCFGDGRGRSCDCPAKTLFCARGSLSFPR